MLQVQTPPGSNKSISGLEDIKRSINSNNSHSGILRPEELSKMFPTPPSLEHHPNSSPCGGAMSDQQLDIMETPNLGSPIDEPIDVIYIQYLYAINNLSILIGIYINFFVCFF